jgi:hypothetical protein
MAIKDTKAYQKASSGYNTALKHGGDIYKATKPYRSPGKSIIAAAKGNLFEFPVFISSSVQLDYATATSSLLEQVYASYVQTALSLNPIIDKSQIDNGTPFSKFMSDTNRYVEYTEMDYAHDAVHNEFELEDGSFLEFDMMSIEDADGKVILEQYNKRPLSEFDHYFQEAAQRPGSNASNDEWADYLDDLQADLAAKGAKLKDQEQRINEKQADITKRERNMTAENKLRSLGERLKADKDALKEEKKRLEGQKRALENEKKQFDLDKKEYEETKRHNEAEEEHKRKQLRHQIVKDRHDQKQHDQERKEDWERDVKFKYAVKAPEMLDETKIKKLNTMKPLMMNASFHVAADDGHISEAINYIVGVKTFNRIIDADTLPEVVKYPLKEMNAVARKAKWRAGELKFFRDIVFKIKQKKQTAVDSRDPKRKWYRRLYELAHMTGDAPTKAAIKGKNVALSVVKSQIEQDFDYGIIPNASLIISSADVANIKAQTGIDLLKGSTATKFCKELFLIALIVVDIEAESIKILLPDNHNDYEVHSIASVNKQLAELSTAGSKTRDIFKLLG